MRRCLRRRSTPFVEPSPLAARPRCSRRPTTASSLFRRVASRDITGASVARDPSQPPLEPVERARRSAKTHARPSSRSISAIARVPVDRPHPLEHAPLCARRDGRGLERRHDLRSVERRRDRALSGRRPLEDRPRRAPSLPAGDDSKRRRLAAGRASVTAEAMPRPLLLASGYEPPFRLLYGAATLPPPRTTSPGFPRRPPGSRTPVRAARRGACERALRAARRHAHVLRAERLPVEVAARRCAIVVAAGGSLALRRRTERSRELGGSALRPAEEATAALSPLRCGRRLVRLVGLLRIPLGREDPDHGVRDHRGQPDDRDDVGGKREQSESLSTAAVE